MNGKELIKALNTIVEEKNISADIIFEAFKQHIRKILIQKLMLE